MLPVGPTETMRSPRMTIVVSRCSMAPRAGSISVTWVIACVLSWTALTGGPGAPVRPAGPWGPGSPFGSWGPVLLEQAARRSSDRKRLRTWVHPGSSP